MISFALNTWFLKENFVEHAWMRDHRIAALSESGIVYIFEPTVTGSGGSGGVFGVSSSEADSLMVLRQTLNVRMPGECVESLISITI